MLRRLTGMWFLLLVSRPLLADSPRQDDAFSLPTIMISPQGREAQLQREPATVQSLSGEQLQAAGIARSQGLVDAVPGLVFTSSAGVGDPYLRGVGGTVSPVGGSSVATFVDGVYLTRPVQSLQDFYDLERVEVIKGPQGVHLGRNVVGGALRIFTRDPVPYREGQADLLLGSYNQRQANAAFNAPLSARSSFRLAGTVRRRDGYSRNVFRGEDIDTQDYYAWRAKLRYRPTTTTNVVFTAEQSKQDDSRDLAKQPDPAAGVNGGIALGGVLPPDPRKVTANVAQQQNVKNRLYHVRLNTRLGALKFESLTAYQKVNLDLAIDLDGTNVDFSSNFPSSSSSAFSQEFRLGSRTEQPLSWVTGLYFLHQDADQRLDVRFPLSGLRNQPDSDIESNGYAVFGGAAYRFASAWRARAGLRYSYDERRVDLLQTITDPLGLSGTPGTSTLPLQAQAHWDAVTPEFDLSYRRDDDTLYYARVAQGFKPGGYNAYALQPAYAPEYLWAYEVGTKRYLPAQRLRINTALFYYRYNDIQLLTLPPAAPAGTLPIIDNAARATIRGLDLHLRYRPRPRLGVSLGLTLLDARFDQFTSVDPNNPAKDTDRAGDPLPRAPKVSLLLGGEYRWSPAGIGAIKLSVDYRYQSSVYFNPYKDRAVRQGAYGVFNASLDYESRKHRWYVQLYGHNLGDKLYAQNIIRLDPVVGTARFWAEPRTLGLRLGYRL